MYMYNKQLKTQSHSSEQSQMHNAQIKKTILRDRKVAHSELHRKQIKAKALL